jgi:hypothetical protein
LLICFAKCQSFSVVQSYVPNVAFHWFRCLIRRVLSYSCVEMWKYLDPYRGWDLILTCRLFICA